MRLCLQAGSAEGCHRERPSTGEAGPPGEDGAKDGVGPREGAQRDAGETAQHGAEKQRYTALDPVDPEKMWARLHRQQTNKQRSKCLISFTLNCCVSKMTRIVTNEKSDETLKKTAASDSEGRMNSFLIDVHR